MLSLTNRHGSNVTSIAANVQNQAQTISTKAGLTDSSLPTTDDLCQQLALSTDDCVKFVSDPCYLSYGNVPNRLPTTTDYADYRNVSSPKITSRDRLSLRFLFRYDKSMAFD